MRTLVSNFTFLLASVVSTAVSLRAEGAPAEVKVERTKHCVWQEQLMLPAFDPACAADFMRNSRNAQDRIELTKLLRDWKPRAGMSLSTYDDAVSLRIHGQPWLDIAVINRGAKAFIVNGRLYVDDSKNPSAIRRVQRFFMAQDAGTRSKQAAHPLLQWIFGAPSFAGVQEENQLQGVLAAWFIEFMRGSSSRQTASGLATDTRDSEREQRFRKSMPEPGSNSLWESWFKKTKFRCADDGRVAAVRSVFGGKQVSLRPVGPKEVEIAGLSPLPLRMKMDLRIPKNDTPCLNYWDVTMKFRCEKAWKDYGAAYLKMNPQGKPSDLMATPNCYVPGGRYEKQCREFLRGQFSDRMASIEKSSNIKYWACADESCSPPKETTTREILKRSSLPNTVNEREVSDFLIDKSMGLLALGQACGDETIRDSINASADSFQVNRTPARQ